MWADMFFKLETGQYYENTQNIHAPVNEKIPANVELVYWDYYSTDADHYRRMLKAHQNIKKRCVVCRRIVVMDWLFTS